jgi:uncharacterized protein
MSLNEFTSSELSRYLDRPVISEKRFKVLLKGNPQMLDLDSKAFEALFHVHYLPALKFSSQEFIKKVIGQCPYVLRNQWTGKKNIELGHHYREAIAAGFIAPVSIRWIDPTFGYGLFAECDLQKGAYIGEYTGIVRQLHRLNPDHNVYCFHYPTKFCSLCYLIIDALLEGNELRFANHSDHPAMEPACAVDRGLLHHLFFAKREVKAGEQLTFNYGPDFWRKRRDLF